MPFIALIDCNNFFASCERVFNPKLIGKPVVILSCNDGCIIARSPEAKALKIPMGAAYFQWKDFLFAHNVVTYSSNFPLYADMSHRVMQTISYFNPEMEIYSIDEAFLYIDSKDPLDFGHMLLEKVLQWTGIPISIGISKTKTLSKVANFIAKKNASYQGVFFPSNELMEQTLDHLPVEEIWGIGSRLSRFLKSRGIHYAAQLRDQEDGWVKNNLTVTGLKTVWELRGIPCLSLEEEPPPKQSIMTSRSFGRAVSTKEELMEAIGCFAARGAEKLREEKRLASALSIFIETGINDENAYANHASFSLSEPTNYTPTFLACAQKGLEMIFRKRFFYKRAGVLLSDLVSPHAYQLDMFHIESGNLPKRKEVMDMMDLANQKYGYDVLQFAALGTKRAWKGKSSRRTPRFTTNWRELVTIKI